MSVGGEAVQRAQEDVGIDKKAHLSAIRINRLTADCLVGQNRCGARMALGPSAEGLGAVSGGQGMPDTSRGDDGVESFVEGLLHGLGAPVARASCRRRACSGLSSTVIAINQISSSIIPHDR